MRGAVLLGERQIEIRHFPDPTPGEGEVVLEMNIAALADGAREGGLDF